MNVYHSQIEDVAEVYEFSPTKAKEDDARVINVPEAATGFVIGAVRLNGETFSRADNVTVSVTHNGQPLSKAGAITEFSDANVLSYISSQPPRGEWMVHVSHTTSEPFTVSVAVFRKPISSILSFANKHRCKACKVAMRALIYALLAKLTAGAVHALDLKEFAKELAELAKEILETLAEIIGMDVEWLKELFGQVGEIFGLETPWGWLARRICEKLGLCPVNAPED